MSVEARSAEAAGGIDYGGRRRSRFLLLTVRAFFLDEVAGRQGWQKKPSEQQRADHL